MHPRLSPLTLGLAVAATSLCVMTLLSASAAGQTPSFSLVGAAPGTNASRVYGLSADGRVAVGASTMTGPLTPGFTWTASQGRTDFGLDAGLPSGTPAFAVSGDGTTVVGGAFPVGGTTQAYRWSGPGTFQALGIIPGTAKSTATGVNGNGSIVVGRSETASGLGGGAFRWTQGTGMQFLGFTRPGDVYSSAEAISRDGSTIVGYSSNSGGFLDAFVWTEAGGMTILPQLPGTPNRLSSARAVNFDGSIIIGSSGAEQDAAIWRNGVVSDLGTPVNWASHARAVNDTGTVVAGAALMSGQQFAFVWTLTGGMAPLADYLTANGVVIPAGWELMDCYSMSSDGLTFGGWASLASGGGQGFVATIPAPASALPIGIVVLAIGSRRRRPPQTCGSH